MPSSPTSSNAAMTASTVTSTLAVSIHTTAPVPALVANDPNLRPNRPVSTAPAMGTATKNSTANDSKSKFGHHELPWAPFQS